MDTNTEYLRLPKAGEKLLGFSRSYFYKGETRGYWKLIRVRHKGKRRGVTMINAADVASYINRQIAQSTEE
jgi:hypothetical protein